MIIKDIIDKLSTEHNASREELLYLVLNINEEEMAYLVEKADEIRKKFYGNKVYMRGLIEFTNYCKMDCKYCGLRRSNKNADRYRLTFDQIMECAEVGNELGYKTIVLQGGEDPYFNDDRMVEIVSALRERFPNNAITLSIGERSYESYEKLYKAGANRFLLRHESATKSLYDGLHPGTCMENRRECLYNLKKIGFQAGAGFMVGLPNQTDEDLVNDLMFVKEFEPAMCGIGPFIPQKDTPLGNEKGGTVEKTVLMLALVRLLLPEVLLPATTALGTIDPNGREKGVKAGGNVVMPNLSPSNVRKKYALYDGKVSTGDEAAESRRLIAEKMKSYGYEVEVARGDNFKWQDKFKQKDDDVIDEEK
ncbi:MAG: [FeFe] hydrogenase H-cluster radical SAM maturase HydE [Sarcina sp.]